ncbi:hypothetical protein ACGFK1_31640 [Mycobacterium sp. NPDC048908]|uniref:hypothetical protein n=1 Tax=Mycobacterium sp. NPDC048908 TaxID=3364292 RepID=UPI00371F7312
MLRIDRPLQVDGAVAFADDEQAGRYYVVATEPQLALRPDGTAALDLIKYRYPGGDQGGILELRVDLTPTALALEALRRHPEVSALVAPQWTDGQATALVPGVGGAQIQQVPMALNGFGEAQFSIAVDAATATVLETALRTGRSPVQVTMSPHVLGRVSSGRMHIFVHGGVAGTTWPNVSGLSGDDRHEALASAGAAGVEMLAAPDGGSAVADQLMRWGWSFVDSLLPADGHPASIIPDKDVIIEGRTVLGCPLTATGTVTGFDSARDHGFVSEADLSAPIMPILDLTVRTNAAFAEDGIAAVLVDISYAGETQTLTFTTSEEELHARFRWTAAHRDTYSYRATIQFAASANRITLPARQSDAHQLTISLDDVGRLTVDVSALAVDWTDLDEIVVTIFSGGGQIPATSEPVRLTGEQRGARYQRLAPGSFADGWSYALDYVFQRGNRIHRGPVPGFGHQLEIDDPYPRYLQIDVHAYTVDDTVRNTTVELRYHDRVRTLVLDAAAPRALARFGTDDPADDEYSWRAVTTYVDGHQQSTPQTTTRDRMLIVAPQRSANLTVRIAADLLDPAVVKLVRINLVHRKSDGTDLVQARALTPGAAETEVNIPISNGEDPSYALTTTVFRVDGTRAEAGPTVSSATAIVLPAQGI